MIYVGIDIAKLNHFASALSSDGQILLQPFSFSNSYDISRFSNPAKLLAFAGLDPAVYQSGNFQARRTRMSKRGSRVLRYALMNAAHNVVKNNQTFKTCKLVRILYKMLTENIAFQLN